MESEKITILDPVLVDRWYDDACGTALGLELLGERWTLLIVRELLFGGRRFSELRAGLPGISANVLSQRLARMEAVGIVARRRLPTATSVQLYELTPWGAEAEAIVQQLGYWAARSPLHDPTLPLSAASIMMSFRTMFAPARAAGVTLTIGFALGNDRFVARVAAGVLDVQRGEAEPVNARISLAPETLAALVYGGLPLAAATASGGAVVSGDPAAIERFVTLFVLPPKTA